MVTLLYNAYVVTGERCSGGAVLINGDRIGGVYFTGDMTEPGTQEERQAREQVEEWKGKADECIDLSGKMIMAGGIDAHVHFREPGMTHKADMESESRAALLGARLAEGRAYANYGFNLGATNSNLSELQDAAANGKWKFGGIKVFMGSSTGNMLVDSDDTLNGIFNIHGKPVLVHCEDEATIKENLWKATAKYGDDIPFSMHPEIRSRQACIRSSAKALELAIRHHTALHLLHVSTAEEMKMAAASKIHNPEITAETSANYLWFSDKDYDRLGSRVKCNPAIKSEADREALREGLKNGTIDTIGSDHAPHAEEEKQKCYRQAPSGMPSIQQSLPVLLTVASEEDIPLERIASAFSEKPAEVFRIQDRGKLKEGFFADIVVIDMEKEQTVTKDSLLYKCGWSPYEGYTLKGSVETVFVNGRKTVDGRKVTGAPAGERLIFG